MDYIVCAFYTSEFYRQQLDVLEDSLVKFQIPYEFVFYENRGSWATNTGIKSEFLLEMLKKHKKRVVYLDADCVVKKYPVLFDSLKSDVAMFCAEGFEDFSHKYLTGTMVLNYTEKTLDFLSKWKDIQIENPGFNDQDSLEKMSHEGLLDSLDIYCLPFGYVKIFDRPSDDEVFIEHYQASRALNKKSLFSRLKKSFDKRVKKLFR